jgi:hypothetical protein
MEPLGGLLGMVLLVLGVFLAIIFTMAAWRVYQDLPKIVNRLNTIITILNVRD